MCILKGYILKKDNRSGGELEKPFIFVRKPTINKVWFFFFIIQVKFRRIWENGKVKNHDLSLIVPFMFEFLSLCNFIEIIEIWRLDYSCLNFKKMSTTIHFRRPSFSRNYVSLLNWIHASQVFFKRHDYMILMKLCKHIHYRLGTTG